jgi:tetratricopeptide (TPR) repeat protein
MMLDKNPAGAIARPDPATAEKMIKEIDGDLAQSTNAEERAGLFLNKANLLRLLTRIDEAKDAVRLAFEQAPDDPETGLACDYIGGGLYGDEGKTSEAYTLLTAALAKHKKLLDLPDHRIIYEDLQRRRAFGLFEMGDCPNAVPLLEEILSFASTERRSVVLANLGNCYARMNDYETARKYLLQALELGDLDDWEGMAHYDLAKTYARLHLLQESKREFELCAERAAKYNLPLEDVHRWLSRICKGLGEKSEAEHYARLARPC